MKEQGDLIFILDIGTRTVIGLVMEYNGSAFQILASAVIEHQQRSMLDGQIHDVNQVAEQVKIVKERLENKLEVSLKKVAIAAAGRALKTVVLENTIEFENKKIISSADVQSLDFSAVQRAQTQLAANDMKSGAKGYHFVGYSVVEYRLDGIFIGNLEGQSGKKIQVKMIATFLPRIVIDSLLQVAKMADLKIEYLTLEPIAVANVVIPKDMFNFNVALVDIGAGTSDIAVTMAGSMVGYAMVPVAGDEITEALAEHYLLDYQAGEELKCSLGQELPIRVKNILSQEISVIPAEAREVIRLNVQSLASQISEAILELNQKSPQAVICVGGGSLTPGLLEEIANYLAIDRSRIGINEYRDIKNVFGQVEGISNAQANTPIGIAVSSVLNKNKANFLDVEVNGLEIQLFTLNKPSVADALLAEEIDIRKIQGLPGMGLTCYVNRELKIVKGTMGTPGTVLLNGERVGIEALISSGDCIDFEPGERGEDARGIIADVVPPLQTYHFTVNGEETAIAPTIAQNGQRVEPTTALLDGADIVYDVINTIGDAVAYLYQVPLELVDNRTISFQVNGEDYYYPAGSLLVLEEGVPVDLQLPLTDGLVLEIIQGKSGTLILQEFLSDKVATKLSVTFNGNKLWLPAEYDLYRNGEEVAGDDQIQPGDQITFKARPISIRNVFDYINYKVTPAFNNRFILTVNGKPCLIDDEVRNGDNINITFRSNYLTN